MEYVTLNNGVKMPILGYGVYQVSPKSTHKERMIENFDVFDFALNDKDLKQISALDTGSTLFFWP